MRLTKGKSRTALERAKRAAEWARQARLGSRVAFIKLTMRSVGLASAAKRGHRAHLEACAQGLAAAAERRKREAEEQRQAEQREYARMEAAATREQQQLDAMRQRAERELEQRQRLWKQRPR